MRPSRVVVFAPALGQDLRFLQRVEDLAVEELIAQLAVERFTVAIFPGAAGLDIERPGS